MKTNTEDELMDTIRDLEKRNKLLIAQVKELKQKLAIQAEALFELQHEIAMKDIFSDSVDEDWGRGITK